MDKRAQNLCLLGALAAVVAAGFMDGVGTALFLAAASGALATLFYAVQRRTEFSRVFVALSGAAAAVILVGFVLFLSADTAAADYGGHSSKGIAANQGGLTEEEAEDSAAKNRETSGPYVADCAVYGTSFGTVTGYTTGNPLYGLGAAGVGCATGLYGEATN